MHLKYNVELSNFERQLMLYLATKTFSSYKAYIFFIELSFITY